MSLTSNNNALIDGTCPLNYADPFLRDIRGWWQSVPGWDGGKSFQDLTGRNPGVITVFDPAVSWRGARQTQALSGHFYQPTQPGTGDHADYGHISAGTDNHYAVQTHSFASLCYFISSNADSTRGLWSRCSAIASQGIEWGVNLSGTSASGVLSFAYNDGSIRGWYQDTTVLSANTWYWLSATWNPTAGTVRFYVNGKFSVSVATTTGTVAYSGDSLQIGFQVDNHAWPGGISNFILASRVWTDFEHTWLYEQQQADFPALIRRVQRPVSWEQPAAGGTTIPVFVHHYMQQGAA